MNRVVIGLLIGVGVVTGLVVLLVRGEKTQRFLRERWQQLQFAKQVAVRLTQATSDVKDTTQPAMKKVKVAGNGLGDLAQQISAVMKQTGQDVTEKTRQMARQR